MELKTGIYNFDGVKIKVDINEDYIIICWKGLKKHIVLKKRGECYECINRSLTFDGYPKITFKNKTWRLNRFMYCLANNVSKKEIKGFSICHQCDNRLCSNPDHLKKGTQAYNIWEIRHKEERKQNIKKGYLTELERMYIIDSEMEDNYLADACGVDVSLIEKVRRFSE